MSTSFSSLLGEPTPNAAPATPAGPTPGPETAGSSFSALLKEPTDQTPSTAGPSVALPSPVSSFSDVVKMPVAAAPAPAPVEATSFSSILGGQTQAEKYTGTDRGLTGDEREYGKLIRPRWKTSPGTARRGSGRTARFMISAYGERERMRALLSVDWRPASRTSGPDQPLLSCSASRLPLLAATPVEGAGLTAIRAIGVSRKPRPCCSRGQAPYGRWIHRQMMRGLVTQSPEFLDALKMATSSSPLV